MRGAVETFHRIEDIQQHPIETAITAFIGPPAPPSSKREPASDPFETPKRRRPVPEARFTPAFSDKRLSSRFNALSYQLEPWFIRNMRARRRVAGFRKKRSYRYRVR